MAISYAEANRKPVSSAEVRRARPFYNPMSFASELQQGGYLKPMPGAAKPRPSKPMPVNPSKPMPPGQGAVPIGVIGRPPVFAKPGSVRADQIVAGNTGRRQNGRQVAKPAAGFQYGPRTQRGGRTPVFDKADLARRLQMRESNKFIGGRLTPFVPGRG